MKVDPGICIAMHSGFFLKIGCDSRTAWLMAMLLCARCYRRRGNGRKEARLAARGAPLHQFKLLTASPLDMATLLQKQFEGTPQIFLGADQSLNRC